MKYTLEKCEKCVCIKDKDGNELSKWKNDAVAELGGLDKLIARAKKLYPNMEIVVVDGAAPAPAPAPAPEPAPAPAPEPAPAPAPEPAPAPAPEPAPAPGN